MKTRLRTIMIFPEFPNQELIDNIRVKYDPLANLVKPHITLVFPFESDISNDVLSDEIQKQLDGIKPFKLTMSGFSKQEDSFGNYIFLDVKEGWENLIQMHNKLYSGVLSEFDLGLPYIPHMTVGKFETVEEMNTAYESYIEKNTNLLSSNFETIVDKVSVEMIGEHEESIIIIERSFK